MFDRKNLPVNLGNFWQWAYSDLLTNTVRGALSEFIVANALGIIHSKRVEWESYDLINEEGVKIEVKNSAYLQSWHQENYSKIAFDIAPKLPWSAETGLYGKEKIRSADVYVFCLFHHKDIQTADPLQLDQWTFFVLPAKVLNEKLPNAKSIGLQSLKSLNPKQSGYSVLKEMIMSANNST